MTPYISEINIYPLKSGAPLRLESSQLTPAGLAHDRRLMLIDETGVCITAREQPGLLHVHTHYDGKAAQFSFRENTFTVHLTATNNPKFTVNIHGSSCTATHVSSDVDRWFGKTLGIRCRLVAMMDEDIRNVKAESNAKDGDVVSFADEHALLLISESSLTDLNQYLDQPVGMRNFRPNLVVKGAGPFAEDNWRRIRIGETDFRVAQPCKRCKLTTIDPDTAEYRQDNEPLKTLLKYRRNKTGSGVNFGVHLAPAGKTGPIRLNDQITILGVGDK